MFVNKINIVQENIPSKYNHLPTILSDKNTFIGVSWDILNLIYNVERLILLRFVPGTHDNIS